MVVLNKVMYSPNFTVLSKVVSIILFQMEIRVKLYLNSKSFCFPILRCFIFFLFGLLDATFEMSLKILPKTLKVKSFYLKNVPYH